MSRVRHEGEDDGRQEDDAEELARVVERDDPGAGVLRELPPEEKDTLTRLEALELLGCPGADITLRMIQRRPSSCGGNRWKCPRCGSMVVDGEPYCTAGYGRPSGTCFQRLIWWR